MKKTQKMLALFISGIISAASISGISTRAIFNTEISAPEGYTLFDDQGALSWNAWNGEEYRAYLVYQKISETETSFYMTNYFRYNYTELVVPIEAYDTYTEIYAEYETELDFEVCREQQTTQDTMTITLFDEKTEDGTYSVDPADYPSKENTLIALCDQLQEVGAIESATYSAVFTISYHGFYIQEMHICNVPDGNEDALQTMVAAYDDDAIVTYTEDAKSGEMYYRVTQLEDFTDYIALAAAVTEAYPEATFENMDEKYQYSFEELAYFTTYGEIDLLTAEPDPDPPVATGTTSLSTGDVDGDGEITIQDAYQALVAYASESAGLELELTEDQRAAADVDGDGEITIADAFKILIYYATESVGRTPSWD